MVLDTRFPPDIRVENEIRSLLEAGFSVSIISIAAYMKQEREPSVFRTEGGTATVHRVHLPQQIHKKLRGVASWFPAFTLFVSNVILRICRTRVFNSIHLHDLWLWGAGLSAGRVLGIPVVGDMHENYPDALTQYAWSTRFPGRYLVNIPRWYHLEAKWGSAVDRLICVNEYMKRRMIGHGVEPERISVVSNTFPRDQFDNYEIDTKIFNSISSPFTVIYVGSFDLHRGLSTLIRAMKLFLLEQQYGRLVLVGEGRIRSELEALSRHLGIEDRVTFTGWQPRDVIKSYLLGSDVGAFPLVKSPHTDSATAHKLFQYMYYKVPVLATNCTATEEIVRSAKCGVVVPSESPQEMAEALMELAENPDKRAEMGEKGHEAVVTRYNWDATVQEMLAMYRELANA